MFKMPSVCLPGSPEALAPFGKNIVDNPRTHRRPHTRLRSSHIMASAQSGFESGGLYIVGHDARASLSDTNPLYKRSQATFVGCVGGFGSQPFWPCPRIALLSLLRDFSRSFYSLLVKCQDVPFCPDLGWERFRVVASKGLYINSIDR